MRTILTLAAFVACIAGIGVFANEAHAQGTNVAVIDISYIFKNHIRFKQAQDDMRKDVEAFEAEIRETQNRMRSLGEKLKTFNAGSPEYKQSEEEVARMASDLQVQTQLKRKEFLEKEAKLYSNTYNEVVGSVAGFCRKNNISLVLRFNSEAIDASSPQSVMQGVNRAIVYQERLNITDLILEDLNRVPPQQAQRPIVPPQPGRPAAGFNR